MLYHKGTTNIRFSDIISLDYLIKDFNTRYIKLSKNEWICSSKNGNYKITLSNYSSTFSFNYTLY